MNRLLTGLALISSICILCACSTAEPLAAADEATRRPANAPGTVDLQACKVDLSHARQMALEASRSFDAATTQAQLAAQQHLALLTASTNTVLDIGFSTGSAHVVLNASTRTALVERARQSPLVLVRSTAKERLGSSVALAKQRANAVRTLLVQSGVRPDAIHLWAGSFNGPDPRTDGHVVVELYAVAPKPLVVAQQAPAASTAR